MSRRSRDQLVGLKLERPLSRQEVSSLLAVGGVSVIAGSSGPQFAEVCVAGRSFDEGSAQAAVIVLDAIGVATVKAYRTKPRLVDRVWSLFSVGLAIALFATIFFGLALAWHALRLPHPGYIFWPVLGVTFFVGVGLAIEVHERLTYSPEKWPPPEMPGTPVNDAWVS